MLSIRNIYIITIASAIVAGFSSIFTNEVKAILFIFAIIMDAFVNKEAFRSKSLLLLIIFYFISFIYVFFLGRGHFVEIRNILLAYPMMLMCFWVAPGLTKLNPKEARFLWYVFLLCLAENLIVTTIIGRINPWALRYYFSGIEGEADIINARAYSQQGVLSYASAHILALLCPLIVVNAFEVKQVWKKISLLFLAFLAIYVMYLTTITTSLLLALIFMMAVVVFYFSKGNTKRFIIWVSILSILLLVTGGLTGLLSSSSQGDNYEIAEKLNDVSETIMTGESQGQIAGREREYNLTWDAIARNPLFGGANGPGDTGQHSLFLDYWAYYGVFCLFFFAGWWRELKRMKRLLNNKLRSVYWICLWPIILLCFLKGPVFLPYYVLATIVILRVGFIRIDYEQLLHVNEKDYEKK